MSDINIAALNSALERLDNIAEEEEANRAAKKEILETAKENGLLPKYVTYVHKLRRQDQAKRQEDRALKHLYESAANIHDD